MIDLRELYQEIILDHNRNPRNHYSMSDANARAQGFNPVCGDKLTVYVKLQDDVIEALSFVGCGCAISQASASLMTEALQGKSVGEAKKTFTQFHQMVTGNATEKNPQSLDKLAVLAGVKAYPARVKCATLAWHTLQTALNRETAVVSTE